MLELYIPAFLNNHLPLGSDILKGTTTPCLEILTAEKPQNSSAEKRDESLWMLGAGCWVKTGSQKRYWIVIVYIRILSMNSTICIYKAFSSLGGVVY